MTPHGYTQFGGVDAGLCDEFQFTWPSDVDRFKAQLTPLFAATDASIASCPAFPAEDRKAWKEFLATWTAFAARKTPTFGSSNEREQACAHARVLDGWRAKVARFCTLVGPEQIQGGSGKTPSLDLVRWIVIGTAIAGGVGLLILYAPEIKLALGGLRR